MRQILSIKLNHIFINFILLGVLVICISVFISTPSFAGAGDLDPTFGDGGRVITDLPSPSHDHVRDAFVTQPDGKIIVTLANVVDFALVRYNPDGSLDEGFGIDGKVSTTLVSYEGYSYDSYPTAVDLQADGKIVVGGWARGGWAYHFALVRYNPDGSLDTTFGNNGMVFTDFHETIWEAEINDLVIQEDGRIVAVGRVVFPIALGANSFAVARYNPDGSLDTTFGIGGRMITDFGLSWGEIAEAVVLQPDGKIIAVGWGEGSSTSQYPGIYNILVRYNPNGTLDESFGTGGKVITSSRPSGYSSLWAYAATLQPDGKIVTAGLAWSWIGLVRYNSDGSIDTTFGTDGIAFTYFGQTAHDVAVQPDGKLVAVGFAYGENYDYTFAMVRCNPDGSLDMTFGTDGTVLTSYDAPINRSEAHAVDVLADGRIVVVGWANISPTGVYHQYTRDIALARYKTDGSLDESFGTGGKVTTDVEFVSWDEAYDVIAIQADGKILIGGTSTGIGSWDFAISRYNPDGSLDESFGDAGYVKTDFRYYRPGYDNYIHNDHVFAIALQDDGKIVAAGVTRARTGWRYPSAFALARYNTDGTLDSTFGTDGRVVTEFEPHPGVGVPIAEADDVVIQPDGRIVAVGTAWTRMTGPPMEFAVVRYNTDGSLDESFGTGGKVSTGIDPLTHEKAVSVALQLDGKIIAGGWTERDPQAGSSYLTDFAMVRYNTDGSMDAMFGDDGIVRTDFNTSFDVVKDIAVQPDGRIVAAGFTIPDPDLYDLPSDAALARYNPDGSLDTTFGADGKVTSIFWVDNPVGSCIIDDLALQDDGRIVAAGSVYQYVQKEDRWVLDDDFALARYNVDGSLDYSFGAGGIVITDFGSPYDRAFAVTLQADGKILVAGQTDSIVGVTPISVRFHTDIAMARYEGVTTKIDELNGLIHRIQLLAAFDVLNHGQANALQAKLRAAIAQVDRDNIRTAVNQLEAFMNEVDAFVAAQILAPVEGQNLNEYALAIIVLLTS